MKKQFIAVLLICIITLLSSATIAEQSDRMEAEFEDYTYSLLEDGTVEIVRYHGSEHDVVIPKHINGILVTAIADRAFGEKHILYSVEIHEYVTRIGANPFTYCEQLYWIEVSPDNPRIANIDGVLFDTEENRLICYPMTMDESAYTIPDWVNTIGDYAFYINPDLQNINIPESVKEIGSYAFYGCKKLSALTIPNSVTKCGANPFAYCKALEELSVSDDQPLLKMIDGAVFNREDNTLITYLITNRRNEYAVPEGTTAIGDSAFLACDFLREITIPQSVTVIGNSAFYSCEYISSFDLPEGIETIGRSAFLSCSKAKFIHLPNTVRSIGQSAFCLCKSITDMVIPSQVTTIESRTFDGCSNLSAVHMMGSVSIIGESAFTSCKSLSSIELPESVTKICDAAFSGSGLEQIIIPVKTASIGYRAFFGCPELTNVRVPESVEYIGTEAFAVYSDNWIPMPNPNVRITLVPDSYAELYCLANGLPYIKNAD